jgi:hypothetical protein
VEVGVRYYYAEHQAAYQRLVKQGGVRVNFSVQDVCALGAGRTQYDVILDGYCLQSIVTDPDRAQPPRRRTRPPEAHRVLRLALRAELESAGFDVLSQKGGDVICVLQ